MRDGWTGALFLGVLLNTGCGEGADIEATGQVAQEQVVCGVGPTVPGIDVSYYQDKPDWKAVAASGIKFAIARTNDGGFMDPEFDRNYKGIRDEGMVRGAYQFFRSTKDPIEYADLMLEKMGPLGPGDLSPVIDVEATNDATPEEMAAKVIQWVKHVYGKTGRKPIIYTGKYFWNDNVKTTALKEFPLWHAQYSAVKCPDIATAWSDWAIWQFTSSGMHPGIEGNVDTNWLNGDELVLQDLAANGYRASVVSLDYPKQLATGETGTVTLVLKNEGARSWDTHTRLGTTEPQDHASALAAPSWFAKHRVLGLDAEVKSGATVTLKFEIVAPAEPGAIVEHLNLVQEDVAWFSQLVPGGGPADDAIALAVEIVPGDSPTGAGGAGGAGGSEGGVGGAGGATMPRGIPDHRADAYASCSAPGTSGGSGRSAALLLLALPMLRGRRRSSRLPRPWPSRP